jgi:hypothetical protein
MKYLLTILAVLPFFAFAQDCNIKKTKDQFSQEPKLTTGFVPFSSTTLSIDADAKEIDFLFSIINKSEEKCFDDASTISFVMEGKQKANFRNTGTMNCEGLFHVTFKNLTTTPITTITLGVQQQKELMDMIACMVKESKSLIKP